MFRTRTEFELSKRGRPRAPCFELEEWFETPITWGARHHPFGIRGGRLTAGRPVVLPDIPKTPTILLIGEAAALLAPATESPTGVREGLSPSACALLLSRSRGEPMGHSLNSISLIYGTPQAEFAQQGLPDVDCSQPLLGLIVGGNRIRLPM